ncbi:MAG: hypothetical protein IT182_11750 [Acidobacteria bacterium]|nr:hypothetical protein [Acidobacteriota bacterium]
MSLPRDGWTPEEREFLADAQDEIDVIRARHRDDPPIDLLRAAKAGVLPDDLQAALDDHLSASPWSRALADGLGETDAPLDADAARRLLARIQAETTSQSPSRVEPRRRWLMPLVLAPALAAAVLVAWVIVGDSGDTPVARLEETRPSTSPASNADATRASTPPPVVLPLDKPPVRLGLTALTWRGAAADNPLLTDLAAGLDAYRRDDYVAANAALTALEPRYPRSIEVLFYQGVSRLFLDDARGAIASFTAAEAVVDPTFADDVAFYRAIAEHRAGHVADARTRFEALCDRRAPRTARACDALDRLTDEPVSHR